MSSTVSEYTSFIAPPHPAVSPLDVPIAVTFFKNYAAATKREELYTPRALAERIRTVTASSKDRLPWLKLARFGDLRTDKNSLRNDENLEVITGIEADYDGGRPGAFDEARQRVEQQGIAAILYTSPSHCEDAPRFRVLCPTSAELSPDQREHMLGRINGLLGGIFSGESFTLSQSYYFGSIKHNPAHRVELIDGTPIDGHDDLDAIWVGKPQTTHKTNGSTGPQSGPLDADAVLHELMGGNNYHQSIVRLGGHYACTGKSFVETRKILRDAMETVPGPDRDQRWQTRFADIDRTLGYVFGKEAAKPNGAEQPAPEPEPHNTSARGTAYGRLLVLGIEDIDSAAPRDYLLKGLLSPAEISIWVGAPKCGKSFLLLHVAYLLSLGLSVFGRRVKTTKVLYVAAEGEGGIANRIRALRAKYGSSENFHFIAQPADLLHDAGDKADLIRATQAVGAQLLVLDTLSRLLAGGDENSPQDMGLFVRNVTEVRHVTKAHIAIVHHGTKASGGSNPRGHSSLPGADDALIEVAKLDDGSRLAIVVHAKDDADGMRWGFALDVVQLGTDDDGDPVTTLLVNEAAEPPPGAGKAEPLSDNQQIGLKTLHAAMRAHAILATVGENGAELRVVAEVDWRNWFYREGKPGETQDTKKHAFQRIVASLQAKDLIGSRDGFIWPTTKRT